MKPKPILCPQRLRQVPPQFRWIDQRLVRDQHIRGRSPQALALYLFLCTVADSQGLSLEPADMRAAEPRLGEELSVGQILRSMMEVK